MDERHANGCEALSFSNPEAIERHPSMRLLELFWDVDDFQQRFQPHWEGDMLTRNQVLVHYAQGFPLRLAIEPATPVVCPLYVPDFWVIAAKR